MLLKNFAVFCGAMLVAGVCAARADFLCEGKLVGFEDGCKISLVPEATHRDEKPTAQTVLKDGAFSLRGNADEPRLFRLIAKDTHGGIASAVFMIGNDHVTLTAGKGKLLAKNYAALENLSVSGSESDKIFREKMRFRDELDKKYDAIQERFREYFSELSAAYRDRDNARIHELKNSETARELSAAENSFFETVQAEMDKNFRANADSFWGPLLVLANVSYFRPGDPYYTSLYENFSDAAKNSFYGRALKEQIFEPEEKITIPPNFSLPDRDGVARELAELTRGKKCVLLDFWASWCAPCRKAVPALKKIYADLEPRGLEIVSISIDQKQKDWIKALDAEKLPWKNLHDDKGVSGTLFRVRAVPAFFLLNANGEIVEKNLNVSDLREKIETLLAE